MPPIHFDWIENDDVNACAFGESGKYFVGINAGTLVYLHLLFSRLLSHPRILSQIGKASTEDESRVPPAAITLGPGNLHSSAFKPVIPKDPDRQFHYEYLNNVAMSFIVSHEITHLIHGHIAYGDDRRGQRSITERRWKKGEREPAITSQTLEMDADMGAAVAQSGFVMRLSTDPALRPIGKLARLFQTPEEAMYHLAFGICPFFRMFGDDSVPAADDDIETYPPWRVRELIAIASATYYISRRWNDEIALKCQQAMKEAIIQSETAYSLVTGEPMSTKGLKAAFGGDGWRHIQDKLIAHWRDELYAELLPFSFIELPEAGDEKYGWKDGKWTKL
ncbi:MAG TPA: hypothetical protein VMR25_06530 [Planctomycetaceae bacterium]|jgi:hypothetical protein|nr:hypothetical protein [Planctomycetaceae bacterium]